MQGKKNYASEEPKAEFVISNSTFLYTYICPKKDIKVHLKTKLYFTKSNVFWLFKWLL